MITLVTETYPPEINGVAMTLQRWVDGLLARNHAVQLVRPRPVCGKPDDAAPALEQIFVPGVPLPCYRALQWGVPCRNRLLSLWRTHRPGIVHIATQGPLGLSALLASRALGIPAVSSYHTNFDQYGQHYRLGFLGPALLAYLRAFHNRTVTTFVPTDLMKARLAACGFANLRVLGRGVDTVLFSPAKRDHSLRAQWGVPDGGLACLYVGRLAAEKNLPLAIQAFLRVREQEPGSRFVLVGDGPARAALEGGHDSLIFAGKQQGEALAAHYASADLFLFPSLTETFGNVITEASASGVPLVAFRNGAAAQHLRHGVSGLLADMNEPAQFIALALRAASDPALRRELSSGARQAANGLDWSGIIDLYERDLISCMKNANARCCHRAGEAGSRRSFVPRGIKPPRRCLIQTPPAASTGRARSLSRTYG